MAGLIDRLRQAFGGEGGARGVASAIGRRMDAEPVEGGGGWRVRGTWNGVRCEVTLDGNRDSLTARVRPPPKAGRFLIAYVSPDDGAADLNFVSERVALSERDADVFEGLPLSLRLHLIDVVEEGRGEARLDDGGLTLLVNRAGLDRPDAADQAAIRLDVLSNLARAFAGEGPAL